MLALSLLAIQLISLITQVVCFVIGIKVGDMFDKKALYGYAIWGGIITVLLGTVVTLVSV